MAAQAIPPIIGIQNGRARNLGFGVKAFMMIPYQGKPRRSSR